MTADEAILHGSQFCRDHLTLLERAYGKEIATVYAAGMASAVRNYVAATLDAKSAYDLYAGLATDILTQQRGKVA